jgi:hypothetical protein
VGKVVGHGVRCGTNWIHYDCGEGKSFVAYGANADGAGYGVQPEGGHSSSWAATGADIRLSLACDNGLTHSGPVAQLDRAAVS